MSKTENETGDNVFKEQSLLSEMMIAITSNKAENDEIIKKVQDINKKKLEYLQISLISDSDLPDSDKDNLKKMKSDDFIKELEVWRSSQDEKYKKYNIAIQNAYNDNAIVSKMHEIEKTGYQELHNNDSALTTVKWNKVERQNESEGPTASGQLPQKNITIDSSDNKITETTVGNVNLQDGTNAKGVRSINIPLKINFKENVGGYHVTFTSKTLNGQNMPEPAIRTSFHYDEEGKLVTACFPAGLKFSNKEPRIGYFKDGDKTYTTGFTYDHYQEIVEKIKQNRGEIIGGPEQDLSHDTFGVVKNQKSDAQDLKNKTQKPEISDSNTSDLSNLESELKKLTTGLNSPHASNTKNEPELVTADRDVIKKTTELGDNIPSQNKVKENKWSFTPNAYQSRDEFAKQADKASEFHKKYHKPLEFDMNKTRLDQNLDTAKNNFEQKNIVQNQNIDDKNINFSDAKSTFGSNDNTKKDLNKKHGVSEESKSDIRHDYSHKRDSELREGEYKEGLKAHLKPLETSNKENRDKLLNATKDLASSMKVMTDAITKNSPVDQANKIRQNVQQKQIISQSKSSSGAVAIAKQISKQKNSGHSV